MNKENRVQRAVRKRDEILRLVKHSFLTHVSDEDNSWRVIHNLIQLELQLERDLVNYLMKLDNE